ncbi:unnamed protein product [Urochloa humidicola]
MATLYQPGEVSLDIPVYTLTYLLMATTGLGYLALTWSTVVLLGGFVTSLQRKDFWCLTVISMMQAARIFNDLGEKLAAKVFRLVIELIYNSVYVLREMLATREFVGIILSALIVPCLWFLAACFIVVFLYGYGGPITCITLALWRIMQRDYSNSDGDTSTANLAPALDLFYGLILCQGALYMIWLLVQLMVALVIIERRESYEIPIKWGYIWLVDYLVNTLEKCWQDTASFEDRTISHYAVDLIQSQSWGDQLSGMRMVSTFIKQGANVRSLLLPSRPLVQKLIDTLRWSARASREMREAAACIVAHLAGDIQLAQFPGAIWCVSTLLQDEATLLYWWNCAQKQGPTQLHSQYPSDTMHTLVRTFKWMDNEHKKHVDDEAGGGCNELILQGLTILEKLASDHHNCMEITSTPGLLPKIMAPLSSNTLIQGIKNNAWGEIVNGTFKVLYRLIRCPGLTGESLRREIASSQQAISNLENIVNQTNEAGQVLQMRAIKILTELALDSSIKLTVETKTFLMKKQLEIFLDRESADISKQLKACAGRALAFLTTNREVNSSIVKDNFGHLTEMLDAKNYTKNRIIAASILENICYDLDKEPVKDSLLPQVLAPLLSNKREPSQRAVQNLNVVPGNDEESQNNAARNGDENRNISAQEGNTDIQKISSTADQNKLSDQGIVEQTATSELQESFLSLTLVIYDKLISTDDFDEAVQKKGLGNGEFVVKIKTILEENCKETVTSLRIVKLCAQIAAIMMSRNQYTEHF